MKKLLSTIMALVMLLSLVPMAVAEEGETAKWSETKSEKHVAQVGDMFYETLWLLCLWMVQKLPLRC